MKATICKSAATVLILLGAAGLLTQSIPMLIGVVCVAAAFGLVSIWL